MKLPDLTGKTVLIVGGGSCSVPTPAPADYVIAASSGIKSAPNADMLVTIDNFMPPHAVGADAGFTGLRVTGVPSDDPNHLYMTLPYEVANTPDRGTVHYRNNGVSAIRIAASCGAKHIMLVGFDPARYDAANAHHGYDGVLATAIPALIAELAGRGIVVEHYVRPVSKQSKLWPAETPT